MATKRGLVNKKVELFQRHTSDTAANLLTFCCVRQLPNWRACGVCCRRCMHLSDL
jgi:hypothetical protein